MRARVVLSCWGLALASSFTAQLRAAEPPTGTPPPSRAGALFDAGLQQKNLGQASKACELFEASVAEAPSPHGWLQVGSCRESGDIIGALAAFEAALTTAANVDEPMRRKAYESAARERIEQLTRRVPTVTFRSSPTPGAIVEVAPAGREVASPVDRYDEAVRFNPGRYQVRAWATAFSAYSVDIELLEGERRVIALPALDPLPREIPVEPSAPDAVPFLPRAAAPPAVDSPNAPVFKLLPVALSGTGVALVISGIVAGQFSSAARSQLERDCRAPDPLTGQRGCSNDLDGTRDRMAHLALASDVLWVSGTLLAGVGITLFVVDQNGERSARLAAECVLGSCGLAARGRF